MKNQKIITNKPTFLDYILLKIDNMFLKIILILLMILIIGSLMVCWPLFVIWAINSLFGMKIEYTFLNWVAVCVLMFSLGSALKITNK